MLSLARDGDDVPGMIENGVTGYLCDSSAEMAARASELASDENKRRAMIFAARERLESDVANAKWCWSPWRDLLSPE